jgi:hypothetical protein
MCRWGWKSISCAPSNVIDVCRCHPLLGGFIGSASFVASLPSSEFLFNVLCFVSTCAQLFPRFGVSSLVCGVATVVWFFAADTLLLTSFWAPSYSSCWVRVGPLSYRGYFVALTLVDALPPWFLLGQILWHTVVLAKADTLLPCHCFIFFGLIHCRDVSTLADGLVPYYWMFRPLGEVGKKQRPFYNFNSFF